MSLFVDVIPMLSDKIKSGFMGIIEDKRDGEDRSVRKVCEVCSKYLEYGELRYDKVENGISIVEEKSPGSNDFYIMLLGVLNESLDEDATAVKFLEKFSGSALAGPISSELNDFLVVGRFVTLGEMDKLESAGNILVDKYINEHTISETITNLYFKAESPEYFPVFQRLLDRAREFYPDSIQVDSTAGYINMIAKNHEKALESFTAVKDKLEQDKESKFYNVNLASIWNSIAGCYLDMDDARRTIESCDVALSHNEAAEDTGIWILIMHKKIEALAKMGEKEQALTIIDQILKINEDDEMAQVLRDKIMNP